MPQLDVKGVMVEFPFEPYTCQKSYMEKVITCLQETQNGILESPTGTGKTLCLLCSSLAWLQSRKAQVELNSQAGIMSILGENIQNQVFDSLAHKLEQSSGATWGGNDFVVPKIIYASRTHSQLTQAIQELKRTAYNSVKVGILGSREQMCIHEHVKRETNSINKVHMCKAKVNNRTCHFYNNFDALKKNGDPRQNVGNIVDIEDLVSIGTKQKLCPYYMSREIKKDADIIFMPYNYLLDARSRKSHGIELQGHIVIFDEAHNLEKICEESASFDLTSTDLALVIEELTQLSAKIIEMAQAETTSFTESETNEPDFTLDDLLRLKACMKEFEDILDSIPVGLKGLTKPGKYIFEVFRQINITYESKDIYLNLLDRIVEYLSADTSTGVFNTKGAGVSKLADALKVVFNREILGGFSLSHHEEIVSRNYMVHVCEEEIKKKSNKLDGWATSAAQKKKRILSYWCFSPGHTMQELMAHGVKCVILTSGTLTPIESFSAEMQISFPVMLQNPHVIDKHQVWIGVLQKGPDGTMLNSSYETRSDVRYQASLGNAIVNYARIIPNGLLVFFPSYPVMDQCLNHWKEVNIWSRINHLKPVFVEPRRKVEFQQAMEDFYTKVNDPALNGAVFVAVCRGKVSEGLDFADTNGRAVIITGLPFPPRHDPKVVLKMKFLDELKIKQGIQSITGNEWYKQQASRAVNQAIGRVIRHRHDYGAIILCDTRFAYENNIRQLPIWLKNSVVKLENFGPSLRLINSFFKNAESTLPQPIPASKRKISAISTQETEFIKAPIKKPYPSMKASEVIMHVPGQNANEDVETKLHQKYFSSKKESSEEGSSSKKNLLDILDQTDKKNENFYSSFATSHPCSSGDSQEFTNLKKQPSKKKIKIITLEERKSLSESRNMSAPSSKDNKNSAKNITNTHLQSAEDYISMVKQAIDLPSYKIFTKALQEYKKNEDLQALITVLADLFTTDPKHYILLYNFYKFIRPKQKQQYNQFCIDLTGQGCGYIPEHSVDKKRLTTEMNSK